MNSIADKSAVFAFETRSLSRPKIELIMVDDEDEHADLDEIISKATSAIFLIADSDAYDGDAARQIKVSLRRE